MSSRELAPNRQCTIRISDRTVAYDRIPAVHHLSGTFAAGSLTAVVGPNGAGKSTLLRAIVGLVRPDEGSIVVGGIDRRRIAYLPQRAQIDQSFPIDIEDAVAFGLWHETGIFGGVTADGRERIAQALAALGLAGFGRRPIGSLSVGQFQRVLFARLLLQDAGLILLDEPFAGLDSPTTSDLVGQIAIWHRQGRTVVAVLHDLTLVRQSFPDTLLMSKAGAVWGPTAAVLTAANLSAAGFGFAGLPQSGVSAVPHLHGSHA